MPDLGTTPLIGCLISVDLLDQLFQKIAETFPLGSVVQGDTSRTASIQSLQLSTGSQDDEDFLALQVLGRWRVQGEPRVPLDATARLHISLPIQNGRPHLQLFVREIHELNSPESSESDLVLQYIRDQVSEKLSDLALDIFENPVVALDQASGGALGPVIATAPLASRVTSKVLPGQPGQFTDAIALLIGLPTLDEDGNLQALPPAEDELRDSFIPDRRSFLPRNNEFSFFYSRAFLEMTLTQAEAQMEGQNFQGATITRLDLTLGDQVVEVDLVGKPIFQGKPVTHPFLETGVKVKGALKPTIARGDRFLQVSPWDLSVSLPGGFVEFVAEKLLDQEVPSKMDVQLEVKKQFMAQLSPLGKGFDFPTEWLSLGNGDSDVVKVFNTADTAGLMDGHLLLFGQGFIDPIEGDIDMAWYSRGLRRFYEFRLSGGRRFSTADLVRLMDAGIITVPRYHTVDGQFIRSNPDAAEGNNLLERFAPRHA